MNNDRYIFNIIDTLRFPLIVIVLYMHIVDIKPIPISAEISGWNIYNFITEFISHNIGLSVVPCFFMFSGFLFFYNIDNLQGNWFFRKLESRFRTLVIPFILWNIIFIIVSFIKVSIGFKLGIPRALEEYMDFMSMNKIKALWVDPIDMPLWYIRDLISVIVISPILYILLKKIKLWGLLLIYILYLIPQFEISSPLISQTAIFFFSIGVYCSMYKKDFYLLAEKLLFPSGIIFITLSTISTFYSMSPDIKIQLSRIFIPIGVIFFIGLSTKICRKKARVSKFCINMSQSVFFIYAFHELYIKNWSKGLANRLGLYNNYEGAIISYIILPVLVLAICLFVYYLLKRYTNKFLIILTGGRS